MLKRHLLSFAACAALLCALPASAQPTLAEIETKVKEAWGKVKSLTGTVVIDGLVGMPGPAGAAPNPNALKLQISGGGNVAYLKDGEKSKYRQVLDAKVMPLNLGGGVELVFDGEQLHVKTTIGGTQKVNVEKPSIDKGAFPPGGGMLLDAVQERINLTPKADAEVNGRKCWVLEGALKPGEKLDLPVAGANLYIDQETGAMAKVELLGKDAGQSVSITVNDLKVDAPLSAADFAPPVVTAAPAPAAAPAS